MARNLKIMEKEKHPLDHLKNDVITEKREKLGIHKLGHVKCTEKRKSKQLEEAVEIAKEYYETYNKYPDKEVFREFFWLFENNRNKLCKAFDDVMKLENNEEKSYKKFKENKSKFSNYEEFIEFTKK